jgi:hypothetical protein
MRRIRAKETGAQAEENMEHNQQSNRVVLCGRVKSILEFSHQLYSEAFYTFMLEVDRLSGARDLLPITISERLLSQFLPHENDFVSICGQLRSYNKMIEGSNRLVLTIFAQQIESSFAACRNEIYLRGYLCKMPVYRTTPFNREIADLLLAVNRAYNKSDYIPCITWGKNARLARELPVGSLLEAQGRIQSREYQKVLPDGSSVTRTAYEVSVASFAPIE